jgi:hypothetical protein
MNNNSTLHAFRDARAAYNYLAADELDEDEYELPAESSPQETTAQARLTGIAGWVQGRHAIDSAFSTCTLTLPPVRAANGYTIGIIAPGSRAVLIIDQWEEKTSVATAKTAADKIVGELGRIKDGWAGPDTVAPSKAVLDDVETVAMRLPSNLKMPAIDVDEEDGSVAIRWLAEDRSRSFSLVFRGNARVSGVFATIEPPRSVSWSLGVAEEVQIASKLEENLVRQLIVN